MLEYRLFHRNHNRIFKSGSFALSYVSLYLFSPTRVSNYFLNSGFMNSKPITHSDADTLYFFALFSRIIYSWSGSIIWSTKLKTFTKVKILCYLLKEMKLYNRLIYARIFCISIESKVIWICHYLIHLKHIQHFYLLFSFSSVIVPQLQEHLLAIQ